jgi:natural product biosynthesis luciferase-like monooxygenase protein
VLTAHTPGAAMTGAPVADANHVTSAAPRRTLDVGLFFFSGDGSGGARDKYRLVLECADFADRHGFSAVWTPERHFTKFGGLFPNPSLLAAALAVSTRRVQLRAGSVVLPLHDPIRVAEEWSVVDNLSGGRVGVAFASGWHADDFVLAPDAYDSRRTRMEEGICTIARLWRGERIVRRSGSGGDVETRIYPNPIQRELPIWLTAVSPATFVRAGELGANVLTGLMERDVESCATLVAAYRQARRDHGFDPETGLVTVMLHTYVGSDLAAVRARVREPMREYLRAFLETSERRMLASADLGGVVAQLTARDRDALLEHAFEQYFATRSLLGTPASCQRTFGRLSAAGVDEVACLLDFGLEHDEVVGGLEPLASAVAAYRGSTVP